MTINWKTAALGGLSGAVMAVIVVLSLSRSGLIGGTDDAAIRNYLMAHPEILISMSNKLQMQQQDAADAARQKAVDKLGLKTFFDPKIAFITGPKDAKNTFVEFSDYNCPYCRASNPTVKAYYKKHKNDTRFAFIEFPIKGENSTAAARLAIAARKQPEKYLAFHFALMDEQALVTPKRAVQVAKKVGLNLAQLQKDEQSPAISATINAALALASATDIDGTPAFIINGKIREGALDEDSLKEMLSAGKKGRKS
jgi:protein-disulfide isomerase